MRFNCNYYKNMLGTRNIEIRKQERMNEKVSEKKCMYMCKKVNKEEVARMKLVIW